MCGNLCCRLRLSPLFHRFLHRHLTDAKARPQDQHNMGVWGYKYDRHPIHLYRLKKYLLQNLEKGVIV